MVRGEIHKYLTTAVMAVEVVVLEVMKQIKQNVAKSVSRLCGQQVGRSMLENALKRIWPISAKFVT